jgi:hypothetical protein
VITMEMLGKIRRMYVRDKMSVRAIAKRTGLSRNTLQKWLQTPAQPVKKDLSAFQNAAPRSILIVPTINKSLDVDAPNYVLAALPIPIAEKGYYVFPVNTTKYVLEQEGFYEGERIHSQPTSAIAKLFGADAVLYVAINRWDAQYARAAS